LFLKNRFYYYQDCMEKNSFFDQYDLKQIEDLDLFAKQVVEGFIIGLHKSPFHGFSVEFSEHRLFNQGESPRNIDWKVFARTEKMFSKKFEEETNLRCQIVMDVSSSMYFPMENNEDGKINKLRFAALAGASLMNLLKRQRDAFGLSLFSDEVQVHTRAKSSMAHYHLMLSFLDKLVKDPGLNRKTAVSQAIHQIADAIHRRSLVIIFTDMVDSQDNLEKLFSAMLHLKHSKHEVLLFYVFDKHFEMDFEYENRPIQFVDMETGEKIKLQSNELKQHYVQQKQRIFTDIRSRCLQYNIDFVPTDISQGFVPMLQAYLAKRNKML